MSIRTFSIAEANEQISPSERWLIEQLRAGRFPGQKVSRHWRMTEQDIIDALDVCRNDVPRISNSCAGSRADTSKQEACGSQPTKGRWRLMHIEEALGRAIEGNPNIDGEGFNLYPLDPAGDQQTQSRLGWRSSQPADPGCCRRVPENLKKATWLTAPR